MVGPEQEQVLSQEGAAGGEGEASPPPAQPAADEAAQGAAPAGEQGQGATGEATVEQEEAQADDRRLEVDMEALLAAAAERDEYLALARRTQADFENYRKRVAKEMGAALRRGIVQLAKELLPAIDNLERALAEAEGNEGAAGEAFVAGIRLVHKELQAALSRVGIAAYVPLGEQFDPTSQEAMAQREAKEGEVAGTVVEVYQPGYRLEELIIRPARVVVAV